MNLIIFYIIVMVSVAGCTIIGYIIFQSSGGNKAASIGQSLTKLLGIAVYFGWMIPVLAFAKNNFDVVGKVGGSLQSAGNNLGKQYGQNRLKGNQYRQGRELRKNWRNQRTKEKALEADMNKMTYSGNNPRKKIRAKFMQSQQIGFLPTRGIKNRRAERDRMMGIAENQVVEESIKKATEEASYKGMSSIPYLNKSAVSITDSKGNAVKDKNGNLAKIDTLGDVYKHLAAGRTIKYKDREGNDRVLDGSQKGMQYMAAGALLKNGDATQAIMLDEIADRGETDEVRASARSSLDYMMKDGGAAFASTVPQLMHIPAKTYMTAGSSKLMGYKPETITIGTTEVLKGDDSTARTQMLNSVRELNTNKNLAGERKQGHMDAFEGSMREELQRSGKVEYNGQNYTNIEHLKTALGYDEWEQRDARPDDQSTPPSTPEPSGTPPSTPEPGTYRDDDGNTRQSGGPGSGGVLLG